MTLIGRAHPLAPIGDPLLFRCGHPREPGNSINGGLQCRLCKRSRTIVEAVDRQIERWRRDELTPREKILRRCA